MDSILQLTKTVKVKLQFKKKKSSRKRISRALAKAHKGIKGLQVENQELQRKSWKMQKKVDRMNKHMRTTSTPITSSSDQSDPTSPSPRTLADKEIRLSRITPRQVSKNQKIRSRLLVANCITSELRQAGKANSKQLGSLRNVIAGKIVKKYRVTKAVSMATGLNRRKMSLSCTKLTTKFSRKRKNTSRSTMSGHIIEFLERDDNSRMMPGEKNFKTVRGKEGPGKEKEQKQILNDYMKNLHEKYLAKLPERKISLAMFCRFRPACLLLVNFAP